jgi:hypothetical protein
MDKMTGNEKKQIILRLNAIELAYGSVYENITIADVLSRYASALRLNLVKNDFHYRLKNTDRCKNKDGSINIQCIIVYYGNHHFMHIFISIKLSDDFKSFNTYLECVYVYQKADNPFPFGITGDEVLNG